MNRSYSNVATRALHRCEYCHAPEVAFNVRFEIEHIYPQSQSGSNDETNLALACRSCNLFKSDHLDGFDEVTQTSSRLFNPRADLWDQHFEVEVTSRIIVGRTTVGRATVARLKMNRELQLQARAQWMRIGLSP